MTVCVQKNIVSESMVTNFPLVFILKGGTPKISGTSVQYAECSRLRNITSYLKCPIRYTTIRQGKAQPEPYTSKYIITWLSGERKEENEKLL